MNDSDGPSAPPAPASPPASTDSRTPRWVVGIDGSADATHALEWALARARDAGRGGRPVRLTALSAWQMPAMAPFGVGGTTMMVQFDDLHAATRQQLDSVIDTIDTTGVDVEAVVVHGGAASALVEASVGAELLIVGSRGHSALRDLVLGSVSRQCCTHAGSPVVVVPREFDLRPPQRVVIGFDQSERSAAAVRWVLGPGADVVGTARLEVLGAFDRSPFEDAELTRERFGDEAAEAESAFLRRLDELDPGGSMVRNFSLAGARRALAEAVGGDGSSDSEIADLVVLGARGRGAIGSALLGSVSNWMLHQLRCPTVIVPS